MKSLSKYVGELVLLGEIISNEESNFYVSVDFMGLNKQINVYVFEYEGVGADVTMEIVDSITVDDDCSFIETVSILQTYLNVEDDVDEIQ